MLVELYILIDADPVVLCIVYRGYNLLRNLTLHTMTIHILNIIPTLQHAHPCRMYNFSISENKVYNIKLIYRTMECIKTKSIYFGMSPSVQLFAPPAQ